MKRNLLILSHQGFSFLEDWIGWCKANQIQPLVVSSQILQSPKDRTQAILNLTGDVMFVARPNLQKADLLESIRYFTDRNLAPHAVVSVWEGYRSLMALGNSIVGANDLSAEAIAGVLDKLSFRNTLVSNGLSAVKAIEATSARIRQWLKEGRCGFIKPRRGLGSYGAFKLNDQTIENLKRLQIQMKRDSEYAGIFSDQQSFIIEDYIPGVEFSFEVVAFEGELSILGVHEKLEVEETRSTTLENLCVSPPQSLDKKEFASARNLLNRAFQTFGLTEGLHHVEMKFDLLTDRWELIEINPRIGGALIKESVHARLNGISLLGIWARTLLNENPKKLHAELKQLEEFARTNTRTTLFRVFFGEPGRIIKAMREKNLTLPKPQVLKLHYQEGAILPKADREVFLGQALWSFENRLSQNQIESYVSETKQTLEVEYV